MAKKKRGLDLVMGLCVLTISAGLGIAAASAQDASKVAAVSAQGASATAPVNAKPQKSTASINPAQPTTASKPAPKPAAQYYVDFRARTAASYGHAFVWYGRVGEKMVEVAGLHPATDSVIPYILGHIMPVLSETGASYGDLDEQYLTARYRVLLNDAEAKKVFAYIKQLQANSPLWNAALYNCVSFIRDIAQFMGLRTPSSHLLYPEDWVNNLRQLNGARPKIQLSSAQ